MSPREILLELLKDLLPAAVRIAERRAGRRPTEEDARAALRMLAQDPPEPIELDPLFYEGDL